MAVLKRRWFALLLLAAVFGMHGLQCTGVATPAAAGGQTMAAHITSGALAAFAEPTASDVPGAVMSMAAPLVATDVLIGPMDVAAAGHDGGPVGAMDHLWTVCLAVLSVGLAVVLIAAVAMLLWRWLPTLRSSARRRGHVKPLAQAPDLFALCVLRT